MLVIGEKVLAREILKQADTLIGTQPEKIIKKVLENFLMTGTLKNHFVSGLEQAILIDHTNLEVE